MPLKFNRSEIYVLSRMRGNMNSPVLGLSKRPKRIGDKRIENAKDSLKSKGWIFKEDGFPILKFTNKAWDNMAEIKALLN